jgi:hypothetical protein
LSFAAALPVARQVYKERLVEGVKDLHVRQQQKQQEKQKPYPQRQGSLGKPLEQPQGEQQQSHLKGTGSHLQQRKQCVQQQQQQSLAHMGPAGQRLCLEASRPQQFFQHVQPQQQQQQQQQQGVQERTGSTAWNDFGMNGRSAQYQQQQEPYKPQQQQQQWEQELSKPLQDQQNPASLHHSLRGYHRQQQEQQQQQEFPTVQLGYGLEQRDLQPLQQQMMMRTVIQHSWSSESLLQQQQQEKEEGKRFQLEELLQQEQQLQQLRPQQKQWQQLQSLQPRPQRPKPGSWSEQLQEFQEAQEALKRKEQQSADPQMQQQGWPREGPETMLQQSRLPLHGSEAQAQQQQVLVHQPSGTPLESMPDQLQGGIHRVHQQQRPAATASSAASLQEALLPQDELMDAIVGANVLDHDGLSLPSSPHALHLSELDAVAPDFDCDLGFDDMLVNILHPGPDC